MPPLNEGVILYMPTTLPGFSVTEAQRLMELQDRILRAFPGSRLRVRQGGRADTSTDPAPFSMMETTVVLKPTDEWRAKSAGSRDWAPGPLAPVLGHIWPEHISWEELINEMDRALQIPGNVNAWTMPIKGRIDMLSTGVRTPIGIKIFGADLDEIQRLGEQIEGDAAKACPARAASLPNARRAGTSWTSCPKREALARYGLTIDDLHESS